MESRIQINKVAPEAYKAMLGLEGFLAKSTLSPIQKELIKIRVSQINGCAYCLDMHTKDALKYGETAQRIFILSVWREAQKFFTEEERVILAMAEEITNIADKGLTKETYESALRFFTETEIAEIIIAVITINSWNRIALSTHLEII